MPLNFLTAETLSRLYCFTKCIPVFDLAMKVQSSKVEECRNRFIACKEKNITLKCHYMFSQALKQYKLLYVNMSQSTYEAVVVKTSI